MDKDVSKENETCNIEKYFSRSDDGLVIDSKYRSLFTESDSEVDIENEEAFITGVEELANDSRQLREENESLKSQLKKERNEFQQYKKQQKRKKEEVKKRIIKDVFEDVLEVRSNLQRAIDEEHEDVESLLKGLEIVLQQLDEVLESKNIDIIKPNVDDKLDPSRHEVVHSIEKDVKDHTITIVHEQGYTIEEDVLTRAKVSTKDYS